MNEAFPEIDFKSMSFPSDAITVGKLRELEPGLFASDHPVALGRSFDHSDFSSMLYWERIIARSAFSTILGLPETRTEGREELVELLGEHFAEYGLSAGRYQTEELVRAIEAQAAEQARKHAGKGR